MTARISPLWLALLLISFPVSLLAQDPGQITGWVVDDQTSEPLAFANVVAEGTSFGAMALDDGSFSFFLPAGTYNIVVSFLGYESARVEGVVVESEGVAAIEVGLTTSVALEMETIEIWGEAPLVDVKSSSVSRAIDSDDLKSLPSDNLLDAMALEAGITVMDGELYVRGGRSGETSMMIDDVPVDDPLGGFSMVSSAALAHSETMVGGFDAEYGNAQSAVIRIFTREGGSRLEGSVNYWTDDYGRQDKTYTNYDRINFGIGGPIFRDDYRWFFSADASARDGEDLTLDQRKQWEFMDGFVKFTERAVSSLKLQGKLTWRVSPHLKLNLESNADFSTIDDYIHNWNQAGYVNRVHIFELLELSGETDESGQHLFYLPRGTMATKHGPWYSDYYLPNKRKQAAGLPTDFLKVLMKYKPAGANQPIYEVVDAMRVKSAWSGSEFMVLTDELFDGYMDTISRWSYVRDDSSQTYYNSAEHTPINKNFSHNLKLVAIHNFSEDVFYKIALTRLDYQRHQAVGDKAPWEYETAGLPGVLHNGAELRSVAGVAYYTDPDNPFLATAYDYPRYADRNSISYILKFDLTSKAWPGHQFKTGFLAQYNDMRNEWISFPGLKRVVIDDLTGRVLGEEQGLSANIFHNYAPLASFYAQDRWEYKGMVVNAGLRYDLFSPGNGVEILLRSQGVDPTIDRYKQSLSPRLGLAFPITDRDVFHFHYGRFIQAPDNNSLFRTQDPNSGETVLGNPDLDPEITISYQAGIKHQFSKHVVGDFALFYKDIFNLITTTSAVDSISGTRFFRFINRAYASARGLELTLSRKFADNYSTKFSYTFSYADGVASDALFGAQNADGLTHLPTKELPLRWDQRHAFAAMLRLADPGSWGGTITYDFGSGFPYTPAYRYVRREDPNLENSARHPARHELQLRAEKYFTIWGQDLTLFFDGKNLLDQDQIATPSPGIYPRLQYASTAYMQYLTETGHYGGAYLTDADGDGEDEFHPVNDPRVFAPHRTFQIGFGFEF